MPAAVAAALTLAGGALAASSAHAQNTPAAAPSPQGGTVLRNRAPVAKDLLRVRLPRPQEFRLPNGVRVFVLEDHRLPTVSLQLSLKAGRLFDAKPGVAEMTASLLREGTATRTAAQIADETERIGADANASAGPELATVSTGGLSEYADRLVSLMADLVQNPSFPEDRLARLKFQRAAALTQQRSDPAFLAAELSARVFYGDTPYSRIAPTPDQVNAITQDDLRAFHQKYYQPAGAVLGIAGDVNAREIVAKLSAAFANWKAAPGAIPPTLPVAAFAPKTATRIFLVDRPGSAQTVLSFGNVALSRTDPDYIALQIANRVLGGSGSARLFQQLREVKGYTYGAYSSLSAPRWPGTFGASASVRTPVTEPAVGEFLNEFRRLQAEAVPVAELDRAKRAIVGSFARTLESPDSVLARFLELVQYDLPLDYWDRYPARVEAVTPADVQRVTRKYLGENRVQLIAVGERSVIEAGLKKYGPVDVYDASGQPASGSGAAPAR